MKCLKCPAWGIDNLGFHGCLIKNSILGDERSDYHCNKQEKTILKAIEDIKNNEPRAKHYKWKHER